MKLDPKKLTEGIHDGLLDLLAAEGLEPILTDDIWSLASRDTWSLASRLQVIITQGKSLPGQHDSEFDHRSRLLCAMSGVDGKGVGPRVSRAIQCYERALRAALAAVDEGGE